MKLEEMMAPLSHRTNKITVRDGGMMDYSRALALQQELREQRMKNIISDTVLLVEHEPVYTIGKDPVAEETLIKTQLPAPVVRIDRGGKITYHGSGQLVTYFIFKMPLSEVGNFVDRIENLTVETVNSFGLPCYSRKEEKDSYGKYIRGAWCFKEGQHRKIAAQGLETKRAGLDEKTQQPCLVTMHGCALNVNTNLSYFQAINPCGFTYDVMTSMQDMAGYKFSMDEVKEMFKKKIASWNPGSE